MIIMAWFVGIAVGAFAATLIWLNSLYRRGK